VSGHDGLKKKHTQTGVVSQLDDTDSRAFTTLDHLMNSQ